MKNTNDITGRPICIGDYIAYTTRQSSSMTTHIGRVNEIVYEPDAYDPYRLKLISVGERWDFSRPAGERYYDGAYKTTLTSNKTIVILGYVPDHIRTLVNEFRER